MNKLKKVFILLLVFVFFVLSGICFYVYIEKHVLYPLKYKEEILAYSTLYNLDPLLVSSLINVESSFNKNAVSNKGAKGLMQLTDSTATYIAVMLGEDFFDLFDAKTNIRYGSFYLSYLLNKFGNVKTALASYNAGEGNVKSWLKNPNYSDDGITLKNIPFIETDNYLKKIYKSLEKYQKLYGNLLDKP